MNTTLSIALTMTLFLSGGAVAAPAADGAEIIPEGLKADGILLEDEMAYTIGRGFNAGSCIAFSTFFGKTLMFVGAFSGNPPLAIAGAFIPAVGAVVCSL